LWEKKKNDAKRDNEPQPQPGQGPGKPGTGQPQPGQGPPQPGQSPGQPNTAPELPKYFGEVQDMPSDKGKGQSAGEEEIRAAEADEKMAMTVAMNVAKRAGKLPGHLERLVSVRIKGELSWREAVAAWKSTICHDDYSWKRPNNKYVQYGMYLPVLENETIDNIIVMVDTSGSIDTKMLQEMIGDIHSLMSTFNIQNMKVLYIDTEINGEVEEWGVAEDCKPNPKGGGGTDFRPGFEWMVEHDEQPVGVVYLTDGYCSRFPSEEPDCPVCWVIVDGTSESFRPPFGEVVFRHLD
jgi:predicted metal-dependent peptidase